MDDDEIKQRLEEIGDLCEEKLSGFEIDFIENIVYQWKGDLTERQREVAEEIITEHLPF